MSSMCWVSDPSLAVVIGSCKKRQPITFRISLLFEIEKKAKGKQQEIRRPTTAAKNLPHKKLITPSRAIPLQRLHFYNISEALTVYIYLPTTAVLFLVSIRRLTQSPIASNKWYTLLYPSSIILRCGIVVYLVFSLVHPPLGLPHSVSNLAPSHPFRYDALCSV